MLRDVALAKTPPCSAPRILLDRLLLSQVLARKYAYHGSDVTERARHHPSIYTMRIALITAPVSSRVVNSAELGIAVTMLNFGHNLDTNELWTRPSTVTGNAEHGEGMACKQM